jgi:hypothetical protein
MGASSSTEEELENKLQRSVTHIVNRYMGDAVRTHVTMDNRNNNLNISMRSSGNGRSNSITGYMAPMAPIPPIAPIASLAPITSYSDTGGFSIGYSALTSNPNNMGHISNISIGHSALATGTGNIAIGYSSSSNDRQRGVTGPSGAESYSMYLGMTGATGPPGIQIPQSLRGCTGPTGICRPQGPRGFTGPIGVIGPIGPRGLTGPIGATGPVGDTGISKSQGSTGLSSSSSSHINNENSNNSAKTYAELPKKPADGKEVPKLEDPPGGISISSVPQSEVQQPKVQQSEEPEKLECKICFERPMNMVILPCRHFCACEKCVSSLKECLICRGKIEDTMKVFL